MSFRLVACLQLAQLWLEHVSTAVNKLAGILGELPRECTRDKRSVGTEADLLHLPSSATHQWRKQLLKFVYLACTKLPCD